MSGSRPAKRWLGLGAGTAAALLGAVLGCNTPYIPIPPPSAPTFSPLLTTDAMGVPHTSWQAAGGPNSAMADAKVSLYNLTLGQGVITKAQPTGAYVAGPFEGALNDRVEVSYENKEGELSPTICVVLQPGAASPCP